MRRSEPSLYRPSHNTGSTPYTDEQALVINHGKGHARVSSVAGSGKTTALIGRINRLMNDGVPAKRIIALMFNRSARNHFYSKLKRESHGAPIPRVQTFHGFSLTLVEGLVKKGVLTESEIISSQSRYARSITNALRNTTTHYPAASAIDKFALFEHQVKSDILLPEEKLKQLNEEKGRLKQQPYPDYFIAAFKLFEKQRKERCIRFFADLIYDAALALKNSPELQTWVTNRFEHILIDECQDINSIQQYIVKVIAGRRASVMVVGDVDQAIYTWNGARPDYLISQFMQDYSNVSHYRLSRSFRYGHILSMAANNCITHNKIRDDLFCLSAVTTPHTQVKVIQHKTQENPLCGIVRYWQGTGNRLKDCLVLVRLNASTIPIEFALLGHEIPYHIHGEKTVFSRVEVRALLGYLRLINGSLFQHPTPQTVIREMLRFPRLQLPEKLLGPLIGKLAQGGSAQDAIASIREQISSHRQREFLVEYAQAWDSVATIASDTSVAEALGLVIEILQLEFSIRKNTSETAANSDQQRLIDGMLSFANSWPNSAITAFLKFCDEQSAFDPSDEEREDYRPRRDAVQIATVHKVKGLESPMVIVTDLEDGLFPLNTHCDDPELLDSERRLFYVAITRAIKQLYCLCPVDPDLDKAKSANVSRSPIASRFVHEMQIRASKNIGTELHNGQTPVVAGRLFADYVSRARKELEAEPKPQQQSHPVSSADSEQPGHISRTRSNPRPNRRLANGTPVTGNVRAGRVWLQMPIHHGAFGDGVITRIRHSRELGEHIDVQFDSGKHLSVPSTHINLTYRAIATEEFS